MAKLRPAGRMRPSRLFLRPFSLKCTIPFKIFLKKMWLLKPKYDIFEEHFRNLLNFHKSAETFLKYFWIPIPPQISVSCLEWTCGPENIQNDWKWPLTKKVWPPLVYILHRRSLKFPFSILNWHFRVGMKKEREWKRKAFLLPEISYWCTKGDGFRSLTSYTMLLLLPKKLWQAYKN
jgi:hypothetical protein